jgi:tryptophan synthase alpha chain
VSRLDHAFAELAGRPALIPFVMAGDPDAASSGALLEAAAAAGDVLEVGVPFSDPIADGPTIQRAAQRALAGGTTLASVLDLVRDLRRASDRPVVLLTYLNPIFQRGVERFCRDAREAGVDGVVVPDLPADEADFLIAPAREADLDTIFLVAPTTSEERIRMAGERSRGFVYCVSLTGVTGARAGVPPEIEALVRRVKAATTRPVCVGFGISTPGQAAAVGRLADGVIVGSALVDLIERSGTDAPAAVRSFLGSVAEALDASRTSR